MYYFYMPPISNTHNIYANTVRETTLNLSGNSSNKILQNIKDRLSNIEDNNLPQINNKITFIENVEINNLKTETNKNTKILEVLLD